MSTRPAATRAHPTVHRHPIYAALVQFPVVCFTLTLLTDIAYWRTAHLMWHNFSSWLLFAGLVVGGVAALVGLLDLLFRRRGGWVHWLASVAVLLLALVNSFVHAGDGWTAIVPWGLVLSAATMLLLLVTAWLGRPAAATDRREVSHA